MNNEKKLVIKDNNTKSFGKIWLSRLPPQFFGVKVWKGCLWGVVVVLVFDVVVAAAAAVVVVDVLVPVESSSPISSA